MNKITIIGTGSVGSTIAYDLSCDGLNVLLIDKKKQIGYPLQCTVLLDAVTTAYTYMLACSTFSVYALPALNIETGMLLKTTG